MILMLFLLGVLLYVGMINPGKSRRHPVLKVKHYAHRGFHSVDGIPENSMAAFRKAKELGYGIEMDIQLTKDRVIVVHHDYHLKRTCGVNRYIRDLTYAQLSQYRLIGTNERIPRFADVLREIDGKVPLLIELKMENCDRELCRLAARTLDGYRGLFCIESFHPYALLWFKRHRPEVIRGQLSEQFFKEKEWKNIPAYFIVKNLLTNFLTRPDFIAYHYKYKNCLPLKICRSFYKIPVYGWTFREKKEYKNNQPYFQGFIFEKFMI